MEVQWQAFHILLLLFTVNVSSDDVPPTKTSFFGLQGDTNLGHSGYVHFPTDETNPLFELSGCQSLDVNDSTCHFGHKLPKTEHILLVMRAWVATTMRDNILGLLGYLLHPPNDEVFTEDTYSSLRIVYEEVRKNNIRTMDILPRLKNISKASHASQIIDFFKILQTVLPPFCKSAIVEIIRVFTKNKIALKNISTTEINDKGIDVFADISQEIIPFLRSKSTRRTYDRSMRAEMGKEFAIFFSAIQEGRIVLTQPVLAALMLNMRFRELLPEDREDFRYLTDILRDSKIPDWSPGIIDTVNIKSPYVLVEMMMKAIANRSQLDPTVKDIVERLHNQLKMVSKSHRSKLMDPFFGKSELSIPLLLDALEEEAKIPEVQTFKQMINDRNLSLSYALKGFVRYFYSTPRDLVHGFMRRIQDRVPMNNETSSIVSKITSALHASISNTSSEEENEQNATKTKRSIRESNHCDLWIPPHLNGISLGYADRQCIHGKNCFTNVFAKIASSYRMKELNAGTSCLRQPPKMSLSAWLESLNMPAVNPNITSLFENISTILTIFVKDNEIRAIIDDIMYQNHSLISQQPTIHPSQGENYILEGPIKLEESITDEKPNATSTSIATKKDLLSRILKDMLSIKKVRARRFVYYEVVRVYCILIHGSVEPMTQSFLDKLRLDDPPFANITELFAENVSDVLKATIDNVTNNDVSESSLNLRNYRSNRAYLTDLLKRILLLKTVKGDNKVFNEVVQLLRLIQDLPIEFASLMSMTYVPSVRRFLDTPGILQKLGEDFDVGRFSTRGRLLRGILEKSLTTLFVRRNETLSRAIKNQISRILCTEAAAEPVREILEGITTDQVNVYKTIQYGLNRQKLTANVQEAYANMWNWYGGSFEPLTHVKRMNISLYDTRSDFLKGFLDKMEARVDEDFREMKADIKLMRSAILETGTGAEPVDYL